MPSFKIAGGSVYFEFWQADAKAPWVTLLGGHARTSADFRMFAKKVCERNFNVVTLDYRGFGQSHFMGKHTMSDLVLDVHCLWGEIGVSRSHVLGISMGGLLAQSLLVTHFDRVDSLTLISTTPTLEYYLKKNDPWLDNYAAILQKLKYYFAPSFAVANNNLIEAMAKTVHTTIQKTDFLQAAQYQRDAISTFKPLMPSSDFAKLKALIIHGLDDQVIAAQAAQKFLSLFSNGEVELLANVGHLVLAESNKWLLERFISFLI